MPLRKFGRYKTERLLGQGSMGAVYKAFDPLLKRHLAIKVMSGASGADEEFSQRFFREAEATAGLNHPNIIAIYDIGEQDRQPYIVIEYLEGEDLDSILKKKAFVPFEHRVEFIIGVCEGLHHAHAQGVIHRDIKPSNVRVTSKGEVKILDFGIAKLLSSEMTATGILMGTPSYMSPEQVIGKDDLDGRSDIFSTGVILYQLITGQKPFPGSDFRTVMMAICNTPHPPLGEVFPGVSEELAQIVDRALAKQREDRFSDAAAMARALRRFRRQKLESEAKRLALEVHKLESDLEKLQSKLSESGDPALFDRDFLEVPMPVHPEQTVLGVFASEDLAADYGWLLVRHGSLSSQRRRLKELAPQREKLNKLAEECRSALKRGQWKRGLQQAEKILQLVPESRKASEWKAESLAGLKEKAREEEIRRTQDLKPIEEAVVEGRFEEALEQIQVVLDDDPTNTAGVRLKALAEEGLAQSKEIESFREEASSLLEAEKFEESLQEAEKGLTLDPGNVELQRIKDEAAGRGDLTTIRRAQSRKREQTVRIEQAPSEAPEQTSRSVSNLLWIPVAGGAALLILVAFLAWYFLAPEVAGPEYTAYQVRSGETLESLAERMQIDPRLLRQWNRIADEEQPVAGRILLLGPPPPQSGRLALDIVPWARIESVQRKSDGKNFLQEPALTPIVLALPPADYVVTATHQEFGEQNFDVEVSAGESFPVLRYWQEFEVDRELAPIFGGPDER